MQFVQTSFLWAFAALAIPVVVHLLFRRRSRRVDLGTLRFLRVVLENNARRRKLKRWLLLSLRMVAVALLAVLFARPFLVEKSDASTGRAVAILIDRSATMFLQVDGRRLIDQAVTEAQQIIDKSAGDAELHVAFFDHTVHPLADELSTADLKEGPLPDVSYRSTNFGAALAWARDVLVATHHSTMDLHVFTDLQRSGLDWSNTDSFPPEVSVHVDDLGRAAVNNLAITSSDVSRTLIRPGDGLDVTCTVLNSGPFPVEEQIAQLILRNGERQIQIPKRFKLAAESLVTVDFHVDSLTGGLWQGTVELQDAADELSFDNRRFLAVMVAEQIPVTILDGRPHASPLLSSSYFLNSALKLANPGQNFEGTPYAPSVVPFGEQSAALPSLNTTDVVVLTDVASVSESVAAQLAEFVNTGGGLLVFTGDNVAAPGYDALQSAGLGIGKIQGNEVSTDLPWRFDQWNEQHPIFTPFNDPQNGDLRRLAFRGITRIKPASDASVLATFRGSVPALIERSFGQGTVLWLATAADRQWGDWPRSRLYLPFVHQMLGSVTGLAEGGPVREASIDSGVEIPDDAPPGLYPTGRHWQVVNFSPRESETERATVEDFAERFELTLFHDEGDAGEVEIAAAGVATTDLRQSEIWHWVILILVCVLLLETLLANRTTV
ncbi:MAG: BatA domain-containing protein [Planctomycetaceae bacterium]